MIVFENNNEIDVRSISTFGISVKEGENPIGFFGTGLKYAIAVLLRNGHSVKIFSGMQEVNFGIRTDTVRGKEFDFVTMAIDDEEPASIGFTTELGKQWELWMAYREIACNCKDESGVIGRASSLPEPELGLTKIIVIGQQFEALFADRSKYILEGKVDFMAGDIEIREIPNNSFFYRGIRVHELDRPSMFTYCDTQFLELTEDRTLKHQYEAGYHIIRGMMLSDNESFLRQVLTAEEKFQEHHLDYHGWSAIPGPTFLKVIGELATDRITGINPTAMKVWENNTKKEFTPLEFTLTPVQQINVERALDFCEKIGFSIRSSYPIVYVESLGNGCLGLAKDNTIYITERVFHLGGTKQLASTLIEEYLHLRQGWADCTRALQNFLFDKIISLGEELNGEPL